MNVVKVLLGLAGMAGGMWAFFTGLEGEKKPEAPAPAPAPAPEPAK